MIFNYLLYIFTNILFIVESSMRTNIFYNIPKNKIISSYIIPYFFLTLIPCIALFLPWFPLTFFYLSWLAICLLQEKLSPIKYHKITDYAKIRFIIFSSLHICVIGAISLITTYTFTEIIRNPYTILSCTAITMILFIVMKFVLLTVDENLHFVLYQQQKKDFRYLYYFLHLSIANILIQSVLCSMKMSVDTSVSYLMFSNFISLLLLVNYIVNLSMIFQVEHAESSFCTLNSSVTQADNRLKELKANVHFDALTKAYSRLYLIQEATRLLDYQILFSLVYIDLNKLKYVNDTFGHKAGDAYLCDFVKAISKNLRSEDCLARFGGDEFIIIMPNCTRDNAFERLNDIRENIKKYNSNFSFSAGISDSNEAFTLDNIISIADKRMYEEKMEKRRNKI